MTISKKLTIQDLESKVASFYKTPLDKMFSHIRAREVIPARFIAWRALYELAGISYMSIGKRYKRDHTTIIHGVNRTRSGELAEDFEIFKIFLLETVENSVEKVYKSSGKAGNTKVPHETNSQGFTGYPLPNDSFSRPIKAIKTTYPQVIHP